MGVSLKPSAQTDFAGLEGVAIITRARFEYFQYPNSSTKGCGLMLHALTLEGDEREQFYSIGKADAWQPTEDGSQVDPLSGGGTIKKSCNFALFMRELDGAGWNAEEDIEDDISVLEGMICDFIGMPVKREGDVKKESTVPVAREVLAQPSEKNDWRKKFAQVQASGSGASSSSSSSSSGASASASGSRRKKRGKSTSASAGAGDSDAALNAKTIAAVKRTLGDYEDVDPQELPQLMIDDSGSDPIVGKKDPDRKAMIALAGDRAWLDEHAEGNWSIGEVTDEEGEKYDALNAL